MMIANGWFLAKEGVELPSEHVRYRFIISLSLYLAVVCFPSEKASAEARPFTVPDLVETTFYGPLSGAATEQDVIVSSPDRRRFFFMSRRGDLKTDTQIYTVRVFSTSAVRLAAEAYQVQRPEPESEFSMSTNGNGEAIRSLVWSDDGRYLTFLGIDHPKSDSIQLYRFDVDNGKMERISGSDGDDSSTVVSYSARGTGVVYRQQHLTSDPTLSDAEPEFIDRQQFEYAIVGIKSLMSETAYYASFGTAQPWQIGRRFLVKNGMSDFLRLRYWISPSGRKAVLRIPVELLPIDGIRAPSNIPCSPNDRSSAYQFVAIDLLTRDTVELSQSTQWKSGGGDMAEVLWSPDDRRVIIVSAAASVVHAHPDQSNESLIVQYDTISGSGQFVAALETEGKVDVSWIAPGKSFSVVGAHSRQVFNLRGGHWAVQPGVLSLKGPANTTHFPGGLTVALKQSANDPPRIVAELDGYKMALTQDDNVLAGVTIARSEPFRWMDGRSGQKYEGALLLPASSFQRPLPLVIQILPEWSPTRFSPGGEEPVATFAAQPLVSSGFAVLNLDSSRSGIGFGPEEGPATVAAVDAAVSALSDRGLIDSHRVGLVGHSRTAYRVDYVITNPGKTRFAAAVSNEGFTASYNRYLETIVVAPTLLKQNFDQKYSPGGDFWHNKESWIQHAPGFNLDRVHTPLLLSMSSNGFKTPQMHSDLELYAGLTELHRPVEYLYLPKGAHVLQWPRGRLASQQATVDWMNFWLRGEENKDMGQPRLDHWRELRAQNMGSH